MELSLLELLTGRMPVDMSPTIRPREPCHLGFEYTDHLSPSLEFWLAPFVMITFSKPWFASKTMARPILRDKDQLEELADPRPEGNIPKKILYESAQLQQRVLPPRQASDRPWRVMEYQDSMSTSNARANLRQSYNTFESDGTSSMFSSGPYSGLSALDTENISRTAVFSEDLHEGR
ncbi:hypothetical protein NC651_007507 [Populus alba x Populus x berolinensis]|nr:hypothetical protein NC651_007507 [Populus alba x Populus x berolinensis]